MLKQYRTIQSLYVEITYLNLIELIPIEFYSLHEGYLHFTHYTHSIRQGTEYVHFHTDKQENYKVIYNSRGSFVGFHHTMSRDVFNSLNIKHVYHNMNTYTSDNRPVVKRNGKRIDNVSLYYYTEAQNLLYLESVQKQYRENIIYRFDRIIDSYKKWMLQKEITFKEAYMLDQKECNEHHKYYVSTLEELTNLVDKYCTKEEIVTCSNKLREIMQLSPTLS